jgi:hypothetical protein
MISSSRNTLPLIASGAIFLATCDRRPSRASHIARCEEDWCFMDPGKD